MCKAPQSFRFGFYTCLILTIIYSDSTTTDQSSKAFSNGNLTPIHHCGMGPANDRDVTSDGKKKSNTSFSSYFSGKKEHFFTRKPTFYGRVLFSVCASIFSARYCMKLFMLSLLK